MWSPNRGGADFRVGGGKMSLSTPLKVWGYGSEHIGVEFTSSTKTDAQEQPLASSQLTWKSLVTRGVCGSATNHGGGEVLRSMSPVCIGYVWKGTGLARKPSISYDSEEDLERERRRAIELRAIAFTQMSTT